jgi:hypothetical protein
MKLRFVFAVTVIFLCAGLAQSGFAQKQVKINFAKGKSEGVYAGVIKGSDYIDYTFKANAGQNLTVLITTKTYAAVFDIFSKNESLISEQDTGSTSKIEIPQDATYTIRVRMMRSQARRNAVSKFKLKLSIK